MTRDWLLPAAEAAGAAVAFSDAAVGVLVHPARRSSANNAAISITGKPTGNLAFII
jgi:hypothetical protein